MATKQNTTIDDTPEGLIDLGYEAPDYSVPSTPKSKSKTVTHYPTFRVCKEAAASLQEALSANHLLGEKFAAIIVLKNTMARVDDDDADENPSADAELEFTAYGLMPHVDGAGGESEESILADLDKLAKPNKDTSESDDEGDDEENE